MHTYLLSTSMIPPNFFMPQDKVALATKSQVCIKGPPERIYEYDTTITLRRHSGKNTQQSDTLFFQLCEFRPNYLTKFSLGLNLKINDFFFV